VYVRCLRRVLGLFNMSCHSRGGPFRFAGKIVTAETSQDQKLYDILPEPDDDENDMLDLAFGLTETWDDLRVVGRHKMF